MASENVVLLENEILKGLSVVDLSKNGKGRGFQATCDLALGEVVLATRGFAVDDAVTHGDRGTESVHLLLQLLSCSYADAGAESVLWKRMQRLHPASLAEARATMPVLVSQFEESIDELYALQEQVLKCTERGLQPHSRDDILLLIVRIDQNVHKSGLFPLAAFFNHSCLPNCAPRAVTKASASSEEDMDVVLEVRCIAPVKAGEELTLCYMDQSQWYLPAAMRQQHLRSGYNFTCACLRCEAAAIDVGAADNHDFAELSRREKAMGQFRCLDSAACSGDAPPTLKKSKKEEEKSDGSSQACYVCGKELAVAELQSRFERLYECFSRVRSEGVTAVKELSGLSLGCTEDVRHAAHMRAIHCLGELLKLCASGALHPAHWLMFEVYSSLSSLSYDFALYCIRSESSKKDAKTTTANVDWSELVLALQLLCFRFSHMRLQLLRPIVAPGEYELTLLLERVGYMGSVLMERIESHEMLSKAAAAEVFVSFDASATVSDEKEPSGGMQIRSVARVPDDMANDTSLHSCSLVALDARDSAGSGETARVIVPVQTIRGAQQLMQESLELRRTVQWE